MEVTPESPSGSPAMSGVARSADRSGLTAAAELRVELVPMGKSLLLPLVTIEVSLNTVSNQPA